MLHKVASHSVVGAIVGGLSLLLLGASSAPVPAPPPGSATIVDAGVADYAGFRIVVTADGHATAVDGAGRTAMLLRADVVSPLFADLAASTPARSACAPSEDNASPLTVNDRIDVLWNAKKYSRLDCSSDPRAKRLLEDAGTIRKALYVQAYRARVIAVWVGGNGAEVSAFTASGLPSSPGDFSTGAFQMDHFATADFRASAFSTQRVGSSLSAGGLSGGLPSGSLPSSTAFVGLPTSSLTSTTLFRGWPPNSVSTNSPFNGSPYNGNPYSGGP